MMPLQWPFPTVWIEAFALGSTGYLFRRHIRLSIPLALLGSTLSLTALHYHVRGLRLVFFMITFGYSLLTFGFHPKVHYAKFHRIGDYSYGLYIFAFPIQQIFLTHFNRPLALFAISYPISLVAAIVSWHFIESPSLAFKDSLRRRFSSSSSRT
ncbi:hypothetical protein SAMN05421770_103124 [Granulicella rosea]|uniref:Acyltransferase family protein n=1 Tax=Granulicella rosea TaxID=474952 RepID=A0A239II05_9BACT|nr:hypothetical protein [Granulicella rosea]SNS93280.1 hypothetical protein SAMN05421770_103124 [Granulicella rosea]